MTILRIVSVLVLLAGLTACQHAPTNQVDPKPPAVKGQASAAVSRAPAIQQTPQSVPVITLHLAQERAEASLTPVDMGGGQALYALPQPVITQADIGRVSPVTSADRRTFLLLEMNQHGIPKLDRVTQQAQGHYLLLSVQGQLVNVVKIADRITDGRLLLSTQNPQHTQAILGLMQGR